MPALVLAFNNECNLFGFSPHRCLVRFFTLDTRTQLHFHFCCCCRVYMYVSVFKRIRIITIIGIFQGKKPNTRI